MNRRQVLIGIGVGGLLGINAFAVWLTRGRRRELPVFVPEPKDQDVEAIAFGRGSARGELVSITADGTLSFRDSTTMHVLSTCGIRSKV
jgi:hypothetical protein